MGLSAKAWLSIVGLTLCSAVPGSTLPKYGGVLTVGLGETPGTGDPIRGRTRADLQLSLQTHRGLVGPPSGTGQPMPGLASRWEASPDRSSWRFWLREDAAFWDGSPVVADDVKESFLRLQGAGGASPWDWLLRPIVGGTEGRLEGVVAEKEDVVRIDLVRPDPCFLGLLGQPAMSVVRLRDGTLMGAGPFALSASEEGEWLLLRCRPGPAGPYLDAVRFLHIPESESRRLEFELGGLDCVFLEVSDYLKLSTDVRWRDSALIPDRPWKNVLLLLNGRKPLLAKPEARDSLKGALRIGDVCDTLLSPLAHRSASLLPSQTVGSPETGEGGSFEAERLPRGSNPGFGELRLCVPLGSSDLHRLAEKMQSDFIDAGLTVSLVRLGWDAMLSGWQRGECDLALVDSSRWGWLPFDPGTGLFQLELMARSEFLPGGPLSGLKEAEGFLRRAWEERDPAHRLRFCVEADAALMESAHWIPLVSLRTPLARNARVHGVRVLGNGLLDLERTWLQEAPSQKTDAREESSKQAREAGTPGKGR